MDQTKLYLSICLVDDDDWVDMASSIYYSIRTIQYVLFVISGEKTSSMHDQRTVVYTT